MTALRTGLPAFRLLGDGDTAELSRMLDADPYVNAVVAARLEAVRQIASPRLGGTLVGAWQPDDGGGSGELAAACFCGGNVLPVGGDPASWDLLAQYLGARPRSCTALTGRAEALRVVWPVLGRMWGPARLYRADQPLLMLDHPCQVGADPQVRQVRMGELDRYLPAAIAMFAEELELRPFTGAVRATYRARLAELIAAGRAFVRLDNNGDIAFKAEIGAVSRRTCQIQGVWVRPDLRGRGIATAAMSTVLGHALTLAPSVSLYVNDFNLAARTVYDRLGMRQVATLATVMF